MSRASPQFSVIVPTKDRPDMFGRALASVRAQRGADFEIIVADDGTGAGAAAAREAGDDRLVAFETGGLGQVPARNMAARRARGRWIAFLDDDDWWASDNHLAALAEALGQGAGLAYASGRIVRETAEGETKDQIAFAAHVDEASIRRDNTLLVSGIGYDRALHAAVGAFDEALPVYWDWDFYLRLAAAKIRFADTGQDGVRISARVDNVSAPGNEAQRRAELARLCAKHRLTGVELKNHESIAVEQARDADVSARRESR